MRAIVVVHGDLYRKMADVSVPRMERVLHCPVEIHDLSQANSAESVWFYKLSLLNRVKETVLCLDADLVFCHFNWDDLDLDKFNAVLDTPFLGWATGCQATRKYYPPEKAINGGFWYCPFKPEYVALFERATYLKTHVLHNFKYAFGDQAALNLALHELQPPIHLLPNSYNWQVPPNKPLLLPNGTHIGHAIGESFHVDGVAPKIPSKLSRLQQLLLKNPPRC